MQLKLSCSSLHQTKRESSNQKNPPPKVMHESEAQLGLIHFDLFAFHPNATQCHGLSCSTFFAALTIWCRARAHWLSSCPPNKCPEPCSSPLSLCKIWNMPIAEQTASSQVSGNGLWLGTRSGSADEIWRLLHYYTQPAHLFFQDAHAQQVHSALGCIFFVGDLKPSTFSLSVFVKLKEDF